MEIPDHASSAAPNAEHYGTTQGFPIAGPSLYGAPGKPEKGGKVVDPIGWTTEILKLATKIGAIVVEGHLVLEAVDFGELPMLP